jgi:hypothetical protein
MQARTTCKWCEADAPAVLLLLLQRTLTWCCQLVGMLDGLNHCQPNDTLLQ